MNFFCLSIFRLLKDNPAIEDNRRMKISRTITSMFSLALPLDFAVTSEGKTRHAPLLFSPFSTTSCAQARSPFPWKFTPFRLRCAPCGTVIPLKVTLGKSAILPRFIKLFGCSVTLPLALPAKIHTFRLRCAPRGTVVPLKDTFAYPFTIFVRRAMLCHCFLWIRSVSGCSVTLLAVLSRRIRPKACVEPRPHACFARRSDGSSIACFARRSDGSSISPRANSPLSPRSL